MSAAPENLGENVPTVNVRQARGTGPNAEKPQSTYAVLSASTKDEIIHKEYEYTA